ncbi:hypothetical protein BLA28_02070 [Eisenbergiella tayi]|nr:hypothetical protein BLA28_02070 [Eisenbergiella tayi]
MLLLFAFASGCGSRNAPAAASSPETAESITVETPEAPVSASATGDETISSEKSPEAEADDSQPETASQDTKDTDSLFSDADLEGFITEFTDDGFRVSVVTKTYDQDSGLIEVSSGEEEASVVCQQNTLYQRLEMDHSTETRNSLKNISQSDLSKDDNLLIFGSQQNGVWQAEKVIAVVWK